MVHKILLIKYTNILENVVVKIQVLDCRIGIKFYGSNVGLGVVKLHFVAANMSTKTIMTLAGWLTNCLTGFCIATMLQLHEVVG